MCGICGLLRPAAADAAADRAEVARMSLALARRGPDGDGLWSGARGRLVLGHRRLAVLDTSAAGAQPMTSADGRFTIVYNGEVYNFRELGRELAARGVALRSASDTEVIVELWRLHGARSLSRLRGMYAFALWDEATDELVLARDPYGIKPLYYAVAGDCFRFASQVRALDASGGIAGDVDLAAVAGFLSWGAVPEPLTIRRAVRALPAGHLLRVGRNGRPRLEEAPRVAPGEDANDPFAAIEASVAAHLVSDVPVGLFLSAGIDSTLIAACARRAAGEPPVALTLTWEEARGTPLDEAPLARVTAERLGLRHLVHAVAAEEVRAALPDLLAAMDQPSIDGFNTWLVARLARAQGFKVALSGLGGDELFGGYRSFQDVPTWERRVRRLRRIPGAERLWRAATRGRARTQPKLPEVFRYGGSFAGAYVLRRGLFLPHEIDRLLRPLVASGERPYDAVVDAWEALGSEVLGDPTALLADPWRVVQRLESSLYLRHQLLRDADWAGMAHGVEIRVPFVDARLLAEIAARDFAPARRQGKSALLDRLAPELARELARRAKTGFQLPIEAWLAGRRGEGPRATGRDSRRLALRILDRLGILPMESSDAVAAPAPAGPR